jgi:Ser-tRNA(Ala) deacylase AlaX
MRTNLLYLEDSYLREMDAHILDVQAEESGKWRVLLDKTVFYPMGGGQPTDQGKLVCPMWSADVYMVMNKNGEIWHYVTASLAPTVGLALQGSINWERRYRNMRLHSAGHIVDFALYLLGYSPKQLMPLKADHGKKPYIIYQGTVQEHIRPSLEAKANELVEKDLTFTWEFQPFAALQKEAIYLLPGLPKNKPLRTLRIETVGAVADGGTQVHTTKEVGKIVISKVEPQGETTVIHYRLSTD